MTETDIHRCQVNPPMCNRPPQLTTSGASAMSGTVCETINQGSSPRSTTRKRAIKMARPMPTTTPNNRPADASRNVYHAPSATACATVRDDPRCSARPNRRTMSHTWGIARFSAFGNSCAPKILPPASGPTVLYSSQHAHTRNSASTNIATRRARTRSCTRPTGLSPISSPVRVAVDQVLAATCSRTAGITSFP